MRKNGAKPLPLDCTCDGKVPYCPPCLFRYAIGMKIAHPDSLSVAMLKRRVPVTGREAALLLEAVRRVECSYCRYVADCPYDKC